MNNDAATMIVATTFALIVGTIWLIMMTFKYLYLGTKWVYDYIQ